MYLLSTPVVIAKPEDAGRRTEEATHYRGVMQRMQHYAKVVFHPSNSSTEFIQCLYVHISVFFLKSFLT